MPKMLSTDPAIHAAQNLIHTLKNPAPARTLVTLGNTHKWGIDTPKRDFWKSNLPSRTSNIANRGGIPRETPTGEQKKTQLKSY